MVRNGNRVVSGSVCWRKMSWGKRKCAGEAPEKENEAWKGCRRWFRSGIIETWTLGSCKGGMLLSPSYKHCLIKFSVETRGYEAQQKGAAQQWVGLLISHRHTSGLAQLGGSLGCCCSQWPPGTAESLRAPVCMVPSDSVLARMGLWQGEMSVPRSADNPAWPPGVVILECTACLIGCCS